MSVNVPERTTTAGKLEVETESPQGHAAAEEAAAICPVRVVTGASGCRVMPRR